MSNNPPTCPICGANLQDIKGKVIFCPKCGSNIEKISNDIPFNEPQIPYTNAIPSPIRLNQPIREQPYQNQGIFPEIGTPYQPQPYPNSYDQTQMNQPVVFVGFKERVYAFIIDMIILFFIMLFIIDGLVSQDATVYAIFNKMVDGYIPTDEEYLTLAGVLRYYMLIVFIPLGIIYYIITYATMNGRSIGKALLKIRVVDERTFQPIRNPFRTLLDTLTKILIIIGFPIGFFILILDLVIGSSSEQGPEKRFRVTQRLSKSVVIKIINNPYANLPNFS